MELVTIIQSGGPYALTAVLAFLYWVERTERKEAQDKLNEVTNEFVERLVTAINAASQATRDVTAAMQTMNSMFQTVMFRLRERSDDDAR